MFPLLGGLITGGASLLGSIFSSKTSADNTAAQLEAQQRMLNQTEGFNAGQTQQAEQFSASQAQIARDYNTTMSNTAYQRASADMTAAGLNPAMMFGSGGAASTPSSPAPGGQAASVGTPTVPTPQTKSALGDLGEVASRAVNSAVSMKTFDKLTQEISNLQAEQAFTKAKTGTEEERPRLVANEASMVRNRSELLALGIPAAQVSSREAGAINKYPPWIFDPLVQASYAASKGADVSDLIGSVISSASGVGKLMRGFRGPSSERIDHAFKDFNSKRGRDEDFRFNYGE